MSQEFEIIVVGAGHAGIEAALAGARTGHRTLMLTLNLDHIGQMSCNPAIGGIGKGHLVREIDALGGEMARAIDETGIQFRRLNTRKGPAVRATRAQADKALYRARMKRTLERQDRLTIRQGSVERLLLEDDRVVGVETELGERFAARAVILTTGTFLKGLMHVGERSTPGGRAGDASVLGLSDQMAALGFRVGRLKTGTCPRLDRRTIDFERLAAQPGDEPAPKFSFFSGPIIQPQIECHLTWTNPATHEIIREGLDRSPIFSGTIKSRGPRYCPSIEDKIFRFADKDRHQIFLEPEGYDTTEIYPNGLSTSLPLDIQERLVRSIAGLEHAEIMRPGYAIEYDYSDPIQLRRSLESRLVHGLYLAGQINGTTGYEEAGAQGLIAGINAGRACDGREPVVLGRDQAYIGVLIDDLATRGVGGEPYRMFTSRAEHRLLLREDNAHARLSAIGRDAGLLDEVQYGPVRDLQLVVEHEIAALGAILVTPGARVVALLESWGSAPIRNRVTLGSLLRRPELSWAQVRGLSDEPCPGLPDEAVTQVEVAVKYGGYVDRQEELVRRFRKMEDVRIPGGLDFASIRGLSFEARERLDAVRPESLGQAARISGVTPAAVALLSVHLARSAAR